MPLKRISRVRFRNIDQTTQKKQMISFLTKNEKKTRLCDLLYCTMRCTMSFVSYVRLVNNYCKWSYLADIKRWMWVFWLLFWNCLITINSTLNSGKNTTTEFFYKLKLKTLCYFALQVLTRKPFKKGVFSDFRLTKSKFD